MCYNVKRHPEETVTRTKGEMTSLLITRSQELVSPTLYHAILRKFSDKQPQENKEIPFISELSTRAEKISDVSGLCSLKPSEDSRNPVSAHQAGYIQAPPLQGHGISVLQHSQDDVTMNLLEPRISFFKSHSIWHKVDHQNERLCSFLPKLTQGG